MQPTTVSETVKIAHSAKAMSVIKLVVLIVAQMLPVVTGTAANAKVNQVVKKGGKGFK